MQISLVCMFGNLLTRIFQDLIDVFKSVLVDVSLRQALVAKSKKYRGEKTHKERLISDTSSAIVSWIDNPLDLMRFTTCS